MQQTITIQNKLGIHARAAMKIIDLAGRFHSNIDIEYQQKCIDAKDMLNVMSLAVPKGDTITLIISGDDAEQAMEAMTSLINRKFDEHE